MVKLLSQAVCIRLKPFFGVFGSVSSYFCFMICTFIISKKKNVHKIYTFQNIICLRIVLAQNTYVALSDPDPMKFQQLLGSFHMDWRTTMHGNEFLIIFPGMLTYVLFLKNCLKSLCMHGCSPIHVEGSFFFLKV